MHALIVLVALCAGAPFALAADLFDNPDFIEAPSRKLFIITHSDYFWDTSRASPAAIDEFFENTGKGMPSVQLATSLDHLYEGGKYFLEHRANFVVQSDTGDFRFKTNANEIWLAGGYLGACLDVTKKRLIANFNSNTERVLTIHYLSAGLFGENAVARFLDGKIAKRWNKDVWNGKFGPNPKVTLADVLRRLGDREAQIGYFARWLKYYEDQHRDYRDLLSGLTMEVQLQGRYLFTYRSGTNGKKLVLDFLL